jgi:D-alanine---(R)-lactate ligase
MDRLKVGIIFGGACEEHTVSVKSAREVARNLDTERYEPFWIGITTSGVWRLCDGPDTDWENDNCRTTVLSPDRNAHGLLILERGEYETVRLDLVFPVLHGKLGEDGAIQGLLELAGVPYVGCDVQSSAICMDKSLAYAVAKSAGIATPNFWVVAGNEKVDPDQLPYPVFVKPARSGSSFGVSKVTRAEELPSALETARQYDSKVLIEEAVVGSEVGCAILGERFGPIAGEVDRVSLSHGFFRIHQEDSPETGSENATFIVPADIPEDSRRLVQETAKAIYHALGCKGLARVDMFLKEDGHIVLNEVNTLPGLTSYSRYPRMMAAAGLPLSEVIDRLASMTLHGKKRGTTTSSMWTTGCPASVGMPNTRPGTTLPANR